MKRGQWELQGPIALLRVYIVEDEKEVYRKMNDSAVVYSICDDTEQMAELAKDNLRDESGLPIGSTNWKRLILQSSHPGVKQIDGWISKVSWGPMGDHPTFSLRNKAGEEVGVPFQIGDEVDLIKEWPCRGGTANYVSGLYVALWYLPVQYPSPVTKTRPILTRILLEKSSRRSESKAPGPDGVYARGTTLVQEVTDSG